MAGGPRLPPHSSSPHHMVCRSWLPTRLGSFRPHTLRTRMPRSRSQSCPLSTPLDARRRRGMRTPRDTRSSLGLRPRPSRS
eukprot:371713-Rhodomonas_salina.1